LRSFIEDINKKAEFMKAEDVEDLIEQANKTESKSASKTTVTEDEDIPF
jgi:hypothetical protein